MAEEQKGLSSEVVFFLGAGASVPAGVPDTYSFVSEFKNSLEENDRKVIEYIESKLIEGKKRKGEEQRVDIELLMEALDKLTRKDDEILLHILGITNIKLSVDQSKWPFLLEKTKTFVKQKTIVPADRVKYLEPVLGFVEEYHPLDIFSVNYDLCIEQFCKVYKRSYRDGFEVEWNPSVFSTPNIDIRLYKLHGSITWYKTGGGGFVKSVIKSDNEKIELLTGEKAESLMLYPMRKWEYAEPLLENLLTLKTKLQSESCKYVVVVGYSFRDEYIRDIFWDAARRNKELILILVDPNAFGIYTDKLEYYSKPDKIPSSLKGKVITLPFRFELVLSDLKAQYLNNLKKGVNSLIQARRNELIGDSKPDWVSCLRPLADCQYVDKLDELLLDKIGFVRLSRDGDGVVPRMIDIQLFDQRIGNNTLLQHEIQYKRTLALYSNNREKKGYEAFLYLAANVYFSLYLGLWIEIRRDRFELRPNTVPGGPSLPAKSLSELYLRLINEIISLNPSKDEITGKFLVWGKYTPLCEKLTKLISFVSDINLYLSNWSGDFLKFSQYVDLRKPDFPQEVERMAQLYPQVIDVINQQNPEHAVITELREIVLKIERKIIKDTFAKYFPEFK